MPLYVDRDFYNKYWQLCSFGNYVGFWGFLEGLLTTAKFQKYCRVLPTFSHCIPGLCQLSRQTDNFTKTCVSHLHNSINCRRKLTQIGKTMRNVRSTRQYFSHFTVVSYPSGFFYLCIFIELMNFDFNQIITWLSFAQMCISEAMRSSSMSFRFKLTFMHKLTLKFIWHKMQCIDVFYIFKIGQCLSMFTMVCIL